MILCNMVVSYRQADPGIAGSLVRNSNRLRAHCCDQYVKWALNKLGMSTVISLLYQDGGDTIRNCMKPFTFSSNKAPTASGQPGICPGRPVLIEEPGKTSHFALIPFRGLFLFLKWKCNALIAFTKCSPFSRINWLIPILSHFKMLDDGTILFLASYART